MTKAKIELRPSYTLGGGIALAGLVVAWGLGWFLAGTFNTLITGAITGGFGVAAAGRLWPGLPLKLMWQYALGVMAYGLVVALLVGG